MEVDIDMILGLEEEGSLDGITTGALCLAMPGIRGESLGERRERSLRPEILIGVIISGDAEEGMVIAEAELRFLRHKCKIIHFILKREFISEAYSIIEEAESDGEESFGMRRHEMNSQLAMVISDGGILTPDGGPGSIGRSGIDRSDRKTGDELRFRTDEAEFGIGDKSFLLIRDGI